MENSSQNRFWVSSIAIFILALTLKSHFILGHLAFYRELYRRYPSFVPGALRSMAEILLIWGALYLVHRIGLSKSLRELYLNVQPWPGLLFGFVVSLPMLLGFALTRRPAPDLSPAHLFLMAVFYPMVEEVQSRGYAIGQLFRRAKWPAWLAILFVAVFTGIGHVGKGQSFREIAGLFALTGLGGATFSWLLVKWESLWFPFAVHMFMNLWWEIFSVSRTALGGWFPFALQSLTMILAIAGTLHFKKLRRPLSPAGSHS